MKTKQKIPVAKNHLSKAFEVILQSLGEERRNNLEPKDFVDLKLSNGKPLFNPEDEKSIAEIHDLSSMMHHKFIDGARTIYNYLKDVIIPARNELIESGREEIYSLITFMSPLLEEHRKREEAALALLEDKGPLTDTVSCPRCGASKVHRILKQTRSADEGITALFTCPNCSLPWAEN